MIEKSTFVTVVQNVLQTLFILIDYCLWVPNLLYSEYKISSPLNQQQQPLSQSQPQKTVVIVGGSFAGLAALRELQSTQEANLHVILIEQREYFEYTPGILRLFCEPGIFSTLLHPLPQPTRYNKYDIVTGTVTETSTKDVTVLDGKTRQKQTVPFDYLIMATGSSYTYPITPSSTESTLESRVKGWNASALEIQKAKSILILGGGAVGTELAAEIACYYNNDSNPSTTQKHKKNVTLIDMESKLVPMFPKATSEYAAKWLSQNGVNLKLGTKLQSWSTKGCTLENGQELKADLVYVCFGMKPNTSPVVQPQDSRSAIKVDSRKYIPVDDCLRVQGHSNIFSIGDVASPPSEGIKQAYNAEVMGHIAGINVLRTIIGAKGKLLKYPEGASGTSYLPLVFVLSLGRYDGVVGFNELCIPGPIAAIVKWLLEWTKIAAILGRPVGTLIWIIGDAVTFFLSKTILLPREQQQSLMKRA